MYTGFLDTNHTRTLLWWSCKNLHDCISTLIISGTSLFSAPTFQHILHRSIDFKRLGFLLLLPLLVVVYQIQPTNVFELQQHSPLSNNTLLTTYIHRVIISPPCLFKHMKNGERVAMLFQCLLDHTQQKLYYCHISLLRNDFSDCIHQFEILCIPFTSKSPNFSAL